MIIIRILVALVQAILKVVADAFVEGGAVLIGVIFGLVLGFAVLWVAVLFTISVFRRVRSR
jgi:hypothetical protein